MRDKTIKIIYWIVTILFAGFMLFSGVSELFINSEAGNAVLISLGYPLYLNVILGVAKILGVIAILQNKFKAIKEWAYAGFAFDLIGAAASYGLNGDGIAAVVFVIPFIVIMFASYFLWKRVEMI